MSTTMVTIVFQEQRLKAFMLLSDEYRLKPVEVKFNDLNGDVEVSIYDNFIKIMEVFDRTCAFR